MKPIIKVIIICLCILSTNSFAWNLFKDKSKEVEDYSPIKQVEFDKLRITGKKIGKNQIYIKIHNGLDSGITCENVTFFEKGRDPYKVPISKGFTVLDNGQTVISTTYFSSNAISEAIATAYNLGATDKFDLTDCTCIRSKTTNKCQSF